MVGTGDLYLLGWAAEELAGQIGPQDRWAADNLVALPFWRGPGSLGLAHPSLVPKGEGANPITDGLLYSRAVGVRVELALALHELGYPTALAAPLLLQAMGVVLEAVDPDTPTAWDEIITVIPSVITVEAVRDWVLEMAFNDELQLVQPN